jgi:hypothetical protein
MTQTEPTVVNRRIVVDAPIAAAFEVFTARFGDFKPPDRVVFGPLRGPARTCRAGVKARRGCGAR